MADSKLRLSEQIPVLPGVSQNGKAPKSSERGLMGKDRERLDAFGGPWANKKNLK